MSNINGINEQTPQTSETIKPNQLGLEDEKTNSIGKEKLAQPFEIIYKKIRGVVSAVPNPSKTFLKTFSYTKTYFNLLSAKFSAWINNASPLSSNPPSNMEQVLTSENNENAVTTTENKKEDVIPSSTQPLDIKSLLSKKPPDFITFFSAYGTSDTEMSQAAEKYPKAFEQARNEDITSVLKQFKNSDEKIAFAVHLYRIAYSLPKYSKSWINMNKLKSTLLYPNNQCLTQEERKKVLVQINKLFPLKN